MVVAIATLFSVTGWFVFKVLAWRREEAERLAKARKEESDKNDAMRKEVVDKSDAVREEIRGWRVSIERKIDGVDEAARKRHAESEKRHAESEKRHAADMAGIKEAVDNNTRSIDRLFSLHGDHQKALEGIKADMARFEATVDGLYRLHKEGVEVHRREIEALAVRLDALTVKVDGLGRRVEGVDKRLAVLRSEFVAFREAVMPRARPTGAAP